MEEIKEDSILICDTLTQTEQRSLIFQLLYAVDAFDYENSLESIVDNFARGFGVVVPLESAVFKTTYSIVDERNELDSHIIPFIENWRPERLGVSTRLILRIALWELSHTNTDAVVIINEAVELAKCFAEQDAYKFINGLLDEYVKRTQEK